MTRKHFRALAAQIAAVEDRDSRLSLYRTAADMCAAKNPRFCRTKFRAACGID